MKWVSLILLALFPAVAYAELPANTAPAGHAAAQGAPAPMPANTPPAGHAPAQAAPAAIPFSNIIIRGNGRIVFNGGVQVPAMPAVLPTDAVLRWKNGETIRGDIATASVSDVSWKTALFEDPLRVSWQAIDRIDWTRASIPVTAPFSIALRDGSFIYGDLTAVTDDSISIHSDRHGDAVLKRSEVLSVHRLAHGSLVYSGPTGNVGWQLMANQPDGNVAANPNESYFTPPLTTGPDGALMIGIWNRSAVLNIALPDRVDVAFCVRSSKRPDFALSLGLSLRGPLRVETWDDELVLVAGDEFKSIQKIDGNEREVALRLCWDKKAQKCSVFNASGTLITTWQTPVNASSLAPGLILQNKGLDLSLEQLQVRAWDGKSPAKIDPTQSRAELEDGRSLAGDIHAGAPGFIKVQAAGQGAAVDVPLANVDALVFSSARPQAAHPEATLSYADGTLLLGSIASITDGRAGIATSFTKDPLPAQMTGLCHLRFERSASQSTPEPPLASLDKIVIQQATLHGRLVGTGDSSLRWMPIGGVEPSRPSPTCVSEITRAIPADAVLPSDPALFYLSSGDVLSGNLGSLDKSGAEFESSLMEARKLPATELDAIQFGAPARMSVQGFDDAGWRVVKGDEKSVRRDKGGLSMDPGTAIFYPSVMESSEIRFKYSSTVFSGTRLRMFTEGTDGAKSLNLLMGSTGNQFMLGLEAGEGQFANQIQMKINPSEPVSVRIVIGEKQVEVFVNDDSLQQIPIDPAKRSGSGLIIEPSSLWGNVIRPITLSDFSANSVPGRTWLPSVNDEIKAQVLTVPRFQKDDPPRHVLLAANGDVLRGEIEAATDSHFGFRCGLETLDIPRDRVKAVIWLKPPEANASTDLPLTDPIPAWFDRRIQGQVLFRGVSLSNLISFIKGQVGDVKFRLPEGPDPRANQAQIGNETLGEALVTICSLFDLHYQIDSDGTIVLETAQQSLGDFVCKTYWLKPDALPTSGSLQDTFTAKGITFPKGTSVQWQPNAQLLTMTNTVENQGKLVALLASDFGGTLGSPTHWLLLTSGSRLALAVDKFEADAITGHNPIYGVCKVPMAQVYIIRTAMPEPTATIRSLEGWRLVNAPEPVIPEGGGESSPILGKDAATFKLPLLDGGDFDLSAEKGHVVVLDFWATWCGPCVKSLPGLIQAMAPFPADRVKLIGLNQGESAEQVKHFMAARGLKFTVALDADQGVAQKYGVDAIPHTVIVGPDGKVAWVQTGYNPDGEAEASDTVKKLLGMPSPDAPPAPKPTP